MKRRVLLTIIFSIIFFSASGEDNTVSGVSVLWEPYVISGTNLSGMSAEIVNAAYKSQGYTLVLQTKPWARALIETEDGEYDIILDVYWNQERAKKLFYSTKYAVSDIIIISLKEDTFTYEGIDSLKGKTIGIIRGYSYTPEFDSSTNFIKKPVNNLLQNINKLVYKRLDLIVADKIVATYIINENDPSLLNKINLHSKSLTLNNLYIASGYKNPRHKEIIKVFNRGLETIKKDGTYDKILAKYNIKK